MRKRIEVAISDIKKLFPRTIHSVTLKGFLIKITMYIFGLQLFKIISDQQVELPITKIISTIAAIRKIVAGFSKKFGDRFFIT